MSEHDTRQRKSIDPKAGPIRFSAGLHVRDNAPKQIEVRSFAEMVEYVDTHRGKKKGENYVCSAMEYGPHPKPDKYAKHAHYRLADSAQPSLFLTMDIDMMNGQRVQEHVLEQIKGICSYAYETSSSTPECPRMRILFALDREVSRGERITLGQGVQAEMQQRVEAVFGNGAIKFDPVVYKPEQPNFCPTVEAQTWEFLSGPRLEVNDILSRTSGVSGSKKDAARRTGASEVMLAYDILGPIPEYLFGRDPAKATKNSFAGATIVLKSAFLLQQIDSALGAIPSDDRDLWIKLGYAAKTLDEDGGDEGRNAWLQWSSKSPKYELSEAERVWESFEPKSTSHQQIFREAENFGWDVQAENARIRSVLTEGAVERSAVAPQCDVSRRSSFGSLDIAGYGKQLLRDVEGMPRREWKIPSLLLVGYIGLIVGPGGVAKSMLQLIAAVSVATGRDLLRLGPVRQCNALVVNNEDDGDELRRRIAAILVWYDIDPVELEGRFFTISGYEQPLLFAHQKNNWVSPSPTLDHVAEFISEKNVGALFVDPFIATHNAPENDNNAMDQVIAIYKRLAGRAGIAISIAHHTRKIGGDSEAHAGDAESGRGASAIKDAARAAVTIARMGQSTAKKLSIPDEERGNYIRMDVGKMNFAAHDSKANWFKIGSVKLSNGDTVGVPVPESLDHLFAQAQDGRQKWTRKSVAAAVSNVFPQRHDKIPWADIKARFMATYGVGKSVAGEYITLLPQEGEPPIRVGEYEISLSRTAPRNAWMIHRNGASDV